MQRFQLRSNPNPVTSSWLIVDMLNGRPVAVACSMESAQRRLAWIERRAELIRLTA